MQMTRNGIPVNVGHKEKITQVKTIKRKTNPPKQYMHYAEFSGYERGCEVAIIVPIAHPNYKALKESAEFNLEKEWEVKV